MQDAECEAESEPPDSLDDGLNVGISIGGHKKDGRDKREYGNAKRAKESKAQRLLLNSYCYPCPNSPSQSRLLLFS